jgi:hypothetical protein
LTRVARGSSVLALLVLGFCLQLRFFESYPQPVLFGDPAGYASVGESFQDAFRKVLAGESARAAFESVRGLFYLLGVGLLFAVVDAVRPGDLQFFRVVLALFNTLAMAGVFALAQRLAHSFAGGVCGLALAATYATFSVQTGRLYPDPVTGCLFVWSAWFYAEAIEHDHPRRMLVAALTLTAALVVRSQVITFFLLVTSVSLAATAHRWLRDGRARHLVRALALGLSPLLVCWALITWSVGAREDVIRLGNFTFKQIHPYGFWQHLTTDGFIGPYRTKQDPYYKAMEAEAKERDPDLLRSRPRQLWFTARYVGARPLESLLIVLDNAYRLYDRPANDYKWDYPYPYAAQVVVQRVIVVLGLAGSAAFVALRPAWAGVYLVPLALAVLHGLVFPWPRYNVPGMPILIASAGAFVAWVAARFDAHTLRRDRLLGLALALAVLGGGLGSLLDQSVPAFARAARLFGLLGLLAVPFVLAARLGPRTRTAHAVAVGLYGLLAVLVLAHAARDRRWHEVTTTLGDTVTAVEQEIRLTPEALGRLRAAPESFVVLDLRVPRGDLQAAVLTVGGRTLAGAEILPTMPRLRESTATGGRDRRAYAQWWAVPLDPAVLPATAAEPLRVRFEVPRGQEVHLGGDRFGAQQAVYEGPSFGDWPHFVALKLEYDGDYRLAVRETLGSAGTRSATVGTSGERREVPFVHRIRLITLGNNVGSLDWETEAVPLAPQVALGFAAYSGNRGTASVSVDGQPVATLPLGARRDYATGYGAWRLCYRAEAPRQDKAYGSYFLVGPPPAAGAPARLQATFETGMSQDPMFLVIDRKRPRGELEALFAGCGMPGVPLAGVGVVLDATRNNYPEDTGRWTVTGVF